jgi:hypothetical protein
MVTAYSPILKLALPVQGELSGTWGDVVNDNITSMVEQAIAGRAVIDTWTTNSHTLTTADGTTSESRCAMLEFTDTGTALSGAGTVICPTLSKIYIAKNASGQNVTLKTSGGTGILVPNGRTMFLFCDGTNVVEAVTSTTSLQLGTSTIVTAVLDEDNMASDSATSLATQQSIKAYVDSQVGANNELSEVLANGNTSGANDIIMTSGQKITTNTIDETTAASGVTIDSVLLKDDGVNATNLEITNIKANDGTAAGSIADSTGVVTILSSILTTADINGGTADGVIIGGTTPAAATVTNLIANTDLIIAGTTTITAVLDEDNMASDSAAALATQQSIKAYVDSQVGTVDTLAEILAIGNTTGATDIAVDSAQKVQFRDAAIYINSSVDGQLDIVADTEIQIAATTIDVNGALDVSGTALVTGVLTTTAATVHTGGITMPDNAKAIFGAGSDLEIYHDGLNSRIYDQGTGALVMRSNQLNIQSPTGEKLAVFNQDNDVELYYDSSQKLATTATGIDVTGTVTATGTSVFASLDISGDIDVDGTTNLDVVDIDGATQIDATVTVGVDDTGYDVKFFGATAGAYMLWDESADDLKLVGAAGLTVAGDIDVDGTTNLDVVDIDGAVDMASTLNVTGAVTGTSVTLTTADNTTQLTLKSTDDDLNSGPELDFYRLSASPADNDYLGRVKYIGRNDNAQDVTAVDILARMVDVSDGTEDATYNIRVMKAGTIIERVTLNETETILNEAGADLDFRVESDTVTHALFVEGSSGNVGIGTTSPAYRVDVGTGSVAGNIHTHGSITSGTLVGYSIRGIPRLTNDTGTFENTYIGCGASVGNIIFQQGNSFTTASNTERMRIDSSGNVGIGTTSPSYNLTVADSIQIFKAGAPMALNFGSASNNTFAKVEYDDSTGDLNLVQGRAYNLKFYTNEVERMRIDASGNVGIGNTTMAAYTGSGATKLVVGNNSGGTNGISIVGATDASSILAFTDTAGTGDGQDHVGMIQYSHIDNSMRFFSNTDERMRIDASGNVLVGATTSAYARFETTRADTGNVGVGRFLASAASGYSGEALQVIAAQAGGTDFNLLSCYYANGAAYAFKVRGDGTIYAQNTTVQSASDARFKENIVNSTQGLDVVTALRPVRFDIKEGHGVSAKTNQLGFIAQEVKAVFPDAVDVWGESDDPENPYLSLGSTALIPVLTKAIQELKAIVDTQASTITTLTERITALEG